MKVCLLIIFLCLVYSCNEEKNLEKKNKKEIIAVKEVKIAPVPCLNEETLDCLSKNFMEVKQRGGQLFEKILLNYTQTINSKCDQIRGSEYLKFVVKEKFDGALEEIVCDSIEKAFVENPNCIIGILSKINDDYITKTIVFYIQSTVFLTPEESKHLIKKLKQNPQYRFLFKD